mgnify:CR=1 FL=1
MKSLNSLGILAKTSGEMFSNAKNSNNFLTELTLKSIQLSTSEIENQFKVDYSKPIKMSANETKRLRQMIVALLKDNTDFFNTHYIQLLAWHIHELKLMKVKTNSGEILQSFLEYAPNPLLPFSSTNKIFKLFYTNRIKDTEKVASALLLNYLNNYKYASARFKKLLRRYLKSIKYSKDIDVYFNMEKIRQYILKKPIQDRKKYLGRTGEIFGLREFTLKTEYFKDVLRNLDYYES